jgi:hypothetical protein
MMSLKRERRLNEPTITHANCRDCAQMTSVARTKSHHAYRHHAQVRENTSSREGHAVARPRRRP